MASNLRRTALRRLLAMVLVAGVAPGWVHAGQVNSVDGVLDRYKHALGGDRAIAKVQSETMRGEIDGAGMTAKAVRRDADLQYALHQPTYFKKLEFAGVTDFEGHPCYWLHGTTNWGKDNNQFYNVQTGLLEGYRFQADNSSGAVATVQFQDYKSFGGPLVATKVTSRSGDRWRTFTYKSVSYAPVADSVFELPQAVKALL